MPARSHLNIDYSKSNDFTRNYPTVTLKKAIVTLIIFSNSNKNVLTKGNKKSKLPSQTFEVKNDNINKRLWVEKLLLSELSISDAENSKISSILTSVLMDIDEKGIVHLCYFLPLSEIKDHIETKNFSFIEIHKIINKWKEFGLSYSLSKQFLKSISQIER